MSANEIYSDAHAFHCQSRYVDALTGYRQVIAEFPDSPEADYSRSQIESLSALVGVEIGFEEWETEGVDRLAQLGVGQGLPEVPRPIRIPMTTAPSLEGFRVTETVEVISAECVFGMNAFRDLFAGVRDIFGGRSKATQKVLRDARKTCLRELAEEAREVGADAVIAVDLDYSEISGQGKSMLFLVASGTAVNVEKIEDAHTPARPLTASQGS